MADPTLTATPAVAGGVPMELIGDSSATVYTRNGAESLKLPVTVYDEDYTESSDTEGGVRVRSRPTNAKVSLQVFVKASASPSGVMTNWKTWEQMIETMRLRKGTITYTPRDGTTPITYLVESAAITEAPQDDVMMRNGFAAAAAEFTVKPYGLLPQQVTTLSDIDPFNRDSFSNQEWRYDNGAGTLSVSNGQLVPVDTAFKRVWRPMNVADATAYLKFTTGASVAALPNLSVMMKRLDSSNNLSLGLEGGPVALTLYKTDAGVTTLLGASSAGVLNTATTYWIKAQIAGNVVSINLYGTDPNGSNPTSFLLTLSVTLAGANATKFGSGVKGSPGIAWTPKGTDWALDDWRVDTTFIESFDPLVNCEILNVPGSVPGLMEVTVTDSAAQQRNHVEIGVDDRYYEKANPQPLLLDSDVLNTSTLEGAPNTTLTGSYNPKASGNVSIRATLSTSRKSIVSTGTQQHIGSQRVLARVQGIGTGPIYARLVYRIGDGSWTKAPAGWKIVNGSGVFNEVDFGTIQIPEGSPSWEGRIEAYTASTSGTDTLDVDYMEVLPAMRFFKATTPTDVGIQSYLIAERFVQGAVNLTGQVVGGNGAVQSVNKSGATIVDGGGPGIATWSNTGFAGAADGAEASASAVFAGTNFAANILRMTMGGSPFALPVGATVRGIEVKVKRRALTNQSNSSGNEKAIDNSVRLTKNGTVYVGNDYRDASSDWPLSSSYKTYGGPNDLWGTTWTRAEINAATFGLGFQPATFVFTGGFGIANTFYVDSMQIRVYYTDSAGNAWVITNSAGTAGQTDVTVTAGGQAQRTTVSDANLDSGRWSRAGGGVYDDVAAAISVYRADQAVEAAGTYRGGLLLRHVDSSNCLFVVFETNMSATPSAFVKVIKRVAGVSTTIASAPFFGSLAGGRRIFAQVDAAGNVTVWVGAIGSLTPTLVTGAGDPVLATGGALDDGFVGFYDAKTGSTANTRNYDDFEVWTPDYNQPVISSFGFYKVDHQQANRAGGGRPLVEGPYLKVNPSGREGRGVQMAVKARRNNVDFLPDTDIADLTRLSVNITPRVALLNP